VDIRNEIKSLIVKRASTLKEVCEDLERVKHKKVSPNNITNKLRRKTIKFNEVQDILEILDYHVEFV